jgi:hypothetical protein
MDGLVSKASDDLAVTPSSADFRNIGLQQNARLRRPLGGALSFADRRLEPARSFGLNRTAISLPPRPFAMRPLSRQSRPKRITNPYSLKLVGAGG